MSSTLQLLHNLSKTDQVALVGLGAEALSSYRFLRAQGVETTIVGVDQKATDELSPEWQKVIDAGEVTLSSSLTSRPALVIKSPGVPSRALPSFGITVEDQPTTSNTQLLFEWINQTASSQSVITLGVTGTKGKSTTAAAIHHVLQTGGTRSILAGNIGRPPLETVTELDDILQQNQDTPIYLVLELSSHQLAGLPHSPAIAVVLDITPEHLDYYADFEEYLEAKTALTRHQTSGGVVIYDVDSVTATQVAELSQGKKLGFSSSVAQDAVRSDETVSREGRKASVIASIQDVSLWYQKTHVIALDKLQLRGKHTQKNLLPAVIIGSEAGLSATQINQALQTFQPLPHRLERVTSSNGIEYYNDSLATTPEAATAALESFSDRPIVLIAGGYDRGLEYEELAQAILDQSIKQLILFKPTGEKILEALQDVANNPSHIPTHCFVESMSEAVTMATAEATKLLDEHAGKPVILLSPAAASFGRFKDYADRGEQFKQAVASANHSSNTTR